MNPESNSLWKLRAGHGARREGIVGGTTTEDVSLNRFTMLAGISGIWSSRHRHRLVGPAVLVLIRHRDL